MPNTRFCSRGCLHSFVDNIPKKTNRLFNMLVGKAAFVNNIAEVEHMNEIISVNGKAAPAYIQPSLFAKAGGR